MRNVNLDFDKNIPMPETVSPTRWECMAIQMRWLVRYGHLLHRYVLSNAEIGSQFPNLITTLHTLEETAWLVFLLEHALKLLAPQDKPTLHLVIPIRTALYTILHTEPCISFQTEEAKAMRKLLIYELTNGCLSISNPLYRNYCEAAIALHPEAAMLVPKEVLVKCTASARKLFDQIVRDRGLNSSLPCNHFDNIIQRTRERDVHPISKDDFINYLKPSSGKLKLAGKSSFTILMISRKYYMKVGRRNIHVASLLQKTKNKQQKGKEE